MANQQLRKETNCLNCGHEVAERFCSHCGQENIEARESFWQLLVHFFNDFTHFDGKFFSTIRVLLLKPGKLTREYISGKRASYLHPIRMYLFISFAFFILQYLIPSPTDNEQPNDGYVATRDSVVRLLDKKINDLDKKISDSSSEIRKLLTQEKLIRMKKNRWLLQNDSSKKQLIYFNLNDTSTNAEVSIGTTKIAYTRDDTILSASLYELSQQKLPPEKRDEKLMNFINKKIASIREKYSGEEGKLLLDWESRFSLYMPKMLFVSLPITAWILLLVYVRRKKWWYTEHAILTIHLYCGIFLLLTLQLFTSAILQSLQLPTIKDWVETALYFGILVYLFFTLYRFYQQSIGKTFLKMVLFLMLQGISFSILFSIFLLLSFLTI
jgi:hypothetical protein